MRLNNKTKIMVTAVTALLIIALLLSVACAGKPPAEEGKTVKVGHIAFSTGPVGDCGLPAVQMAGDMIRWINDHGGIDGVKIEFNWIDSGYEVPRSVAAYQRLKEWGAQVLWSFGTTPNDAIMQMAKEDGMPVVCWGGAAELFFPVEESVFFSTYESYDREGRAGIIWMMNNLPELPKPPKVGLIHPDDAYGWSFANGPLSYADTDGYQVVANTLLPHGALDATTQVRQCIEAEADIIWLTYTAGTGAVVMRDARQLGFKGPLLVTHYSTIDYAIGKLSEGAAEGAYFNTHTYLLADQRPGMEELYDIIKTYHPEQDPLRPVDGIACYLHAPIAIKTVTEGIRAAMNKVGYENLSRQAIWEGLESLNNVDCYGLMNLSFTPDDHTGSMGFGMFRYENGDFKLVGDFVPAPPIADWEKQGKFIWTK